MKGFLLARACRIPLSAWLGLFFAEQRHVHGRVRVEDTGNQDTISGVNFPLRVCRIPFSGRLLEEIQKQSVLTCLCSAEKAQRNTS